MHLSEARKIFNQNKSEIYRELDSFNSPWTISELYTRLFFLEDSFKRIEFLEAMNILKWSEQ